MAYEAYVSIHGKLQGPFRGNPRRGGGASLIEIAHLVDSPRDPGTGMATGRRIHKPVKITKEWGASSPQIYQALVSHEVLNSVVIEFVDANGRPRKRVASRIEFRNATVAHIQHIGRGQEEVVFLYEDIEASGGAPPPPTGLAFVSWQG